MTLRDTPDDRHLRPVPNGPPDDDGRPQAAADTQAEAALLTALLLDPTRTQDIASELTGSDFYQPRNEAIWNALQHATADSCTDITLTREAVANHLTTHGHARHTTHLLELATGDGDPLYIDAYITTIRNAARLRAVAAAARHVLGQVEKGNLEHVDETLARLVDTTADAATRYGPTTHATPTGRRDLSWLLAKEWPPIPQPTYGRTDDGNALFYPGHVNGIFGKPEAAKTWLAMVACLEAIRDGQLAVIVDVDHNGENVTTAHLLLLGATAEQLADPKLFIYYTPSHAAELKATVAELVALRPAIVILDSIGEIVPMMGAKSVDNDELSMVLRAVAQPLAEAGACVITIDHLPKGSEAANSGYAIGGTAKKRAIRGSYIHAEVVGNLNPAAGKLGKIALRIEKDSIGELRRVWPTKYIGHFNIDSRGERATKTSITREGLGITPTGEFRPTHLMETVAKLIEDYPECSTATIEKTVRAKRDHVRIAISRLLEDAYITTNPGPRNSTLHTSLKPYREADDENL